jgi:hypothetical protein
MDANAYKEKAQRPFEGHKHPGRDRVKMRGENFLLINVSSH